jgi:transcriptional regulator with XRE-family HTH domain
MSSEKSFGGRLKALRRALGVSQEELASRCQRSVEAISNIERGLNFPSFELLVAIAAALQVEVGQLFEEETPSGRSELLARMMSHARSLADDDLIIAVEQIGALARARPRSRS